MKLYTAYDFSDIKTFINNKHYERALEELLLINSYSKEVLKMESPYTLYYISYCHYCMNNYTLAIEWISKAIELDLLNYEFARLQNDIYLEIENRLISLIPYGNDHKNEILKTYDYLFKCGFVRSSLQFEMIRYYQKINELEKAYDLLLNYLDRNPNDKDAQLMMESLNAFGTNITKNMMKKIRSGEMLKN